MLIKNTTLRVIRIGAITLMPGMNNVSEDLISKNESLLKEKIKSGDLESAEEQIEDDFAEGLAAYNAQDAISLVKETADEELLAEWKLTEKRVTVLKAIDAQMEEIAKGIKDEE